ncbi:MAG: hypothetical protein IJE08_15455 [Clostridia bacterium]|nr:hypothetical protein [Clostridia bacterium]
MRSSKYWKTLITKEGNRNGQETCKEKKKEESGEGAALDVYGGLPAAGA